MLLQVQGSWCSRSRTFQRRTHWSAWELGRGFCEARAQTWGEAAAEGVCRQKGAPCFGEVARHGGYREKVPQFGAHCCRRMQRRRLRARRTDLQLRSPFHLCRRHWQKGSLSKKRDLSRCEPCTHARTEALHARVTIQANHRTEG